MKERGQHFDKQTIGISHADCLELALDMKEQIKAELNVEEVVITDIGAAIGSHTGPGTIAIFFLTSFQLKTLESFEVHTPFSNGRQ